MRRTMVMTDSMALENDTACRNHVSTGESMSCIRIKSDLYSPMILSFIICN